MKEEIKIPAGVSVVIKDNNVTVSGKLGTVNRVFKGKSAKYYVDNDKIILESVDDRKKSIAESRAILKHLNNLVSGVEKKFAYTLRVVYSHFPITLALKNNELHISNFAGEKKVRVIKILNNVDVKLKGKDVVVSSCDKEAAGTIAGLIEKSAVVRNRDRRIYQDGIYIVEKGVQNE